MNDILQKLEAAMNSLAKIDNVRWAVGRAITLDQQEQVSRIFKSNPNCMEDFLGTQAGKEAAQLFADELIKQYQK